MKFVHEEYYNFVLDWLTLNKKELRFFET